MFDGTCQENDRRKVADGNKERKVYMPPAPLVADRMRHKLDFQSSSKAPSRRITATREVTNRSVQTKTGSKKKELLGLTPSHSGIKKLN